MGSVRSCERLSSEPPLPSTVYDMQELLNFFERKKMKERMPFEDEV